MWCWTLCYMYYVSYQSILWKIFLESIFWNLPNSINIERHEALGQVSFCFSWGFLWSNAQTFHCYKPCYTFKTSMVKTYQKYLNSTGESYNGRTWGSHARTRESHTSLKNDGWKLTWDSPHISGAHTIKKCWLRGTLNHFMYKVTHSKMSGE